MITDWTGREAAALRAALRMSVREFAAHLDVSARIVCRWEAERECITPRPLSQQLLDAALRLADDETRQRFDALLSPPVATGEDAERVVAALDGCHTDAGALDAVAEVLAGLRKLEDATSAADVLPSVHQHTALASRLADNARGDVRPQAVGLLSELEQYEGWLAIPTQRWDDARHHLDRAATLALEADDPQRLATALSFQAYRHILTGQLRQAEALNRAAARDTRVDPGLRAYMIFQRAEVLAHDGDRTAALDALNEAEASLDRIDVDELPASSYWYTPAVLLGHKGFVLAALGDVTAARRAAAESLEAMPPEWAASEWAEQHRQLAELDH
ncbi:XRE family transcriptional regulator [Haloechinothrix salitolerans]|uniref:XRE family transcriptional regulator n=1 Tax=Haloechinothrix salitolerans TaxID=926830 RepID=A0ABW2C737_9PSEU